MTIPIQTNVFNNPMNDGYVERAVKWKTEDVFTTTVDTFKMIHVRNNSNTQNMQDQFSPVSDIGEFLLDAPNDIKSSFQPRENDKIVIPATNENDIVEYESERFDKENFFTDLSPIPKSSEERLKRLTLNYAVASHFRFRQRQNLNERVSLNGEDNDEVLKRSLSVTLNKQEKVLVLQPDSDTTQTSPQGMDSCDNVTMPPPTVNSTEAANFTETNLLVEHTLKENEDSKQNENINKYNLSRFDEIQTETTKIHVTCSLPSEDLTTKNRSVVSVVDSILEPLVDSNNLKAFSECTEKNVSSSEQAKSDSQGIIGSLNLYSHDVASKVNAEFGSCSLSFIQKLRGAAFRRKMNLSRSRDSFVAQEKEHREAIAASKAARFKNEDVVTSPVKSAISQTTVSLSNESFKALPLPSTNGTSGCGGLSGVPKVEKRPATVPCSPLLGSRRLQCYHASHFTQDNHSMKIASIKNSSGVAGIPKVTKRPITVPTSPQLGNRRSNYSKFKRENVSKQNVVMEFADSSQNESVPISLPPRVVNLSLFGGESVQSEHGTRKQTTGRLVGLQLLKNRHLKQNVPIRKGSASSRCTNSIFVEYDLHSTKRAQRRFEYDAIRFKNEQARLETERSKRLEMAQALQSELMILKDAI